MPQQSDTSRTANETTRAASTAPSRPSEGARNSANTISTIFNFKKVAPASTARDSSLVVLNETRPLSLFYHADKNLGRAIKSLKAIRGGTSSTTFIRRNERVHRLQRTLLDSIHVIYLELPGSLKCSREYRSQLPPEDQRELEGGFSENILFAAQALARGFRIRGIESFTSDLIEPAKCLCAALEAVRAVLLLGARNSNNGRDLDQFYPVLRDFDKAWAKFEQKICFWYPTITLIPFSYFHVTHGDRSSRADDTQMFQVLVSETIMRAVRHDIISDEDINNFEPRVILAIPRLAIVSALVHLPDCVNVTDSENGFRWFRQKAEKMKVLKSLLAEFSKEDITILEEMLVDCEALETSLKRPLRSDANGKSTSNILKMADAGNGSSDTLDAIDTSTESRASASHPVISQSRSDESMDQSTVIMDKSVDLADKTAIVSESMLDDILDQRYIDHRDTLKRAYRDVCVVADDLQSGPRAREFVGLLQKAFKMHIEQ